MAQIEQIIILLWRLSDVMNTSLFNVLTELLSEWNL